MRLLLFSMLFISVLLNASSKKTYPKTNKEQHSKQQKRAISKSQNNTPSISQKAKDKPCKYKNNHGGNCNRKS